MSTDADTLVAAPGDDRVEPLTSMEGAGLTSSVADLGTALGSGDAAQIGTAAVGAGLDALGTLANPFEALDSSGIGWVIEHVWFLHEALDALAGDPKQITAQAQTWRNVSRTLSSVAGEYPRSVPGPDEWTGAAGDGYRAAAHSFTETLNAVAAQTDQLANLVLLTGAAVGTERALIRDLIAEFVIEAAKAAWAALMTVEVTAGASVLACAVGIASEAIALGERIAARISRLLDALAAAGSTAGQLATGMRSAVAELRVALPATQVWAKPLADELDEIPLDEAVEAGKQFTAATLEEPTAPGG